MGSGNTAIFCSRCRRLRWSAQQSIRRTCGPYRSRGSGYTITLLFKDSSLGKYRLGTSPNTLRKTLVKALGLL